MAEVASCPPPPLSRPTAPPLLLSLTSESANLQLEPLSSTSLLLPTVQLLTSSPPLFLSESSPPHLFLLLDSSTASQPPSHSAPLRLLGPLSDRTHHSTDFVGLNLPARESRAPASAHSLANCNPEDSVTRRQRIRADGPCWHQPPANSTSWSQDRGRQTRHPLPLLLDSLLLRVQGFKLGGRGLFKCTPHSDLLA